MCLTILEKTNKRIARTNILVYKCLDYDLVYGYCTPYQYYPIYFINDEWAEMKVKHFTYSRNRKDVEEGIHAYYDKSVADDNSRRYFEGCGTKTYYAIIPKGAKYYIGHDNDIVVTELFIFKTKKDYENYVKKYDEKICIIDKDSLLLQEI